MTTIVSAMANVMASAMPELTVGGPGTANASPSKGSTALIKVAGVADKMDPVREARLRQAAGEFESMLLSSFWKSIKGSFAADGDESSDPAYDSLEDLGIQAMSTAVGKSGGLGLGKLILKHLEAANAAGVNPKAILGKPLAADADK